MHHHGLKPRYVKQLGLVKTQGRAQALVKLAQPLNAGWAN